MKDHALLSSPRLENVLYFMKGRRREEMIKFVSLFAKCLFEIFRFSLSGQYYDCITCIFQAQKASQGVSWPFNRYFYALVRATG